VTTNSVLGTPRQEHVVAGFALGAVLAEAPGLRTGYPLEANGGQTMPILTTEGYAERPPSYGAGKRQGGISPGERNPCSPFKDDGLIPHLRDGR